MKDKLNVGDVICATYGNFEGVKTVGIFLILYSENQDRIYSNNHSNYTCCKITTNNFVGNGYTVRLREGDANLENECLVNVSKLHTLTKEQTYKKLGTLNSKNMLKVFRELNRFSTEMNQQILQTI